MDRLVARGSWLIEQLLVALLAAMVVLVFGNVVLRYVFNAGITVSEELSRWAFVWLTFLGAVLALRERAHLGTDLLLSRLGPRGRRACLALAQALMLWMTWLMGAGAWAQTLINLDVEAPVTGLPMAVVYGAGVVFAALTAVLLLREAWRTLSGQRPDDELVMVQESEDLAQLDELDLGPRHPPSR